MNLDLVRDLFEKGGVSMYPLLALSILSIATILERLWFWINIAVKERAIVNRVLEAARYDWGVANEIARQANRQPIGRFLYAPLRLQNADPEVFRLALEAAADDEIANMRRGDKVLEAVIALSPLLGLLGTVLGLINSLRSIRLGDLGTSSTAGVTLGIGEALISTATGLVVAITSLAFYRLFQAFIFQQAKVFRKAGSELELLYRQFWPQAHQKQSSYYQDSEPPRYQEPAPERSSRNRRQLQQIPPELPPDTFEAPPSPKPRLKQATPPEEPNSEETFGVAEPPIASSDVQETVNPAVSDVEITADAAEPVTQTEPPKKGIKDRFFGWGKKPVEPSTPANTETENPFTTDVSEPDIGTVAVSETPTLIQPAETIIWPVETPTPSAEDSKPSETDSGSSNEAETPTKIEDSNSSASENTSSL